MSKSKRSEILKKLKAPIELDDEDSTLGEAAQLVKKLKKDQMRPKRKKKKEEFEKGKESAYIVGSN